MASLGEFSRRINVRAKSVADNADRMVRRVALAADQAIVSATPVDTGRARANWIVQLGSASSEVREPRPEGEKGSTGAANVANSVAEAEATIGSYRGGVEIHITNNLPYVQRLNDGYSAQAPANYVERGVLAAVKAVTGGKGIVE